MIEQDQLADALANLIEVDLVSVQIYEFVLDHTKRKAHYDLIAGLRDDHEQYAADLLRFLDSAVTRRSTGKRSPRETAQAGCAAAPNDPITALELIKAREEVVIDAYYHAQMLPMPEACRDVLRKNTQNSERQLYRIAQAVAQQVGDRRAGRDSTPQQTRPGSFHRVPHLDSRLQHL